MPEQIERRPLLAALLSAIGLASAASSSRAISPEQAPAEWVAYAETATRAIAGWLSAETPPAPRIRAVLDQGRPTPDQPVPPLVLKVWVGRDGAITRVEFASLSDTQADQDLDGLLIGKRLAPPPRGMRLPMRIALQLEPKRRPACSTGSRP